MPLAHMDFKPSRAADREAFADGVSWYATLLYRNGQIGDAFLCDWVGPALRLAVFAVNAAALKPGALSTHAQKAFQSTLSHCSNTPRWATEPAGDFEPPLSSPGNAPSLYIQSPHFASDSVFVLRDGGTGSAVPIFTLPMPDSDREKLVMWNDRSAEFYMLWISSGSLEMRAWREHAAVRSSINARRRELAAAIECATGKPTYLELFRYYHFADNREMNRPCPGCGKRWKRPACPDIGLASFHFRCDRCRLVQDRGIGERNSRAAAIGEWRSATPIPSAADLRRGLRARKIRL